MAATLRLLTVLAAAYAQCTRAQNATVPTGTGTDPAWLEYDAPFAQLIPPIFRVLLMIALGIVGFGTDLNVLQHWGMNIWSNAGPTRLPVHRTVQSTHDTLRESGAISLYVLAGAHCAWLLLCWALYRVTVDPVSHERTLLAQCWEVVAFAGLLAFWFIPNPFWHAQRASMRYVYALISSLLSRIFSLSLNQTIQFSDVIFADVLTSFAKVLGDVWLSLVVVAYSVCSVPVTERLLWSQQASLAVPLLISVPYLVRFRQCVSEYRTSSPLGRTSRSTRPLYNALKYASAFPVIWLSAFQRKKPDTQIPGEPGHHALFVSLHGFVQILWLIAVLFNTLFSFWWDLTNDWGLDLLLPSSFMAFRTVHLPELHRRSESRTHVLRADDDDGVELPARPTHARRGSILRVPEKPLPLPTTVYYGFIVVNLVLRFTWSLKLSSHLQYLVEWQRGLLLLEALELVRRTVWILLRVEWELVKREAL